jgi:hypothetical protein
MSNDLHDAIMRLPCNGFDYAYKEGHRDARHAAAELALGYVAAPSVASGAQEQDNIIRDAIRVAYMQGYDNGKDDGKANSSCSRYVPGNVEAKLAVSVRAAIAAQASQQEKKAETLATLLRTLEVIAVGDAATPNQIAADALFEVGHWNTTNIQDMIGAEQAKPSAEDYSEMLREFFCCYAAGGYNDGDNLVPIDRCKSKLEWIVEDQRAHAAITAQAKPVEMSDADILAQWEITRESRNFYSMMPVTDDAIIAFSKAILANSAPNKGLVEALHGVLLWFGKYPELVPDESHFKKYRSAIEQGYAALNAAGVEGV